MKAISFIAYIYVHRHCNHPIRVYHLLCIQLDNPHNQSSIFLATCFAYTRPTTPIMLSTVSVDTAAANQRKNLSRLSLFPKRKSEKKSQSIFTFCHDQYRAYSKFLVLMHDFRIWLFSVNQRLTHNDQKSQSGFLFTLVKVIGTNENPWFTSGVRIPCWSIIALVNIRNEKGEKNNIYLRVAFGQTQYNTRLTPCHRLPNLRSLISHYPSLCV